MCIKKIISWFRGDDDDDDIIIPPPIVDPPPVPPNTTKDKYALLVGINQYADPSNDLAGCVNDVSKIREFLIGNAGFSIDNIRVLTDLRATKQGIIERLNWLVNNRLNDDELVFYYSGHGSQVRDRNGDELNDYKDEILCPHDMNWDDPLTDDIVGAILRTCNRNAYLTAIIDACHSGTITKDINNPTKKIRKKSKFIIPPYDIRARSLESELKENVKIQLKNDQRHVLFSGCKDDQTSLTTTLGGSWGGLMTKSLVNALHYPGSRTWKDIYSDVIDMVSSDLIELGESSTSQTPQLSGDTDLLNRTPFGI